MWDWCGACRLVGRIVGLLDALSACCTCIGGFVGSGGYILLLEKPFCRALTRGWWEACRLVGLPCIVGLSDCRALLACWIDVHWQLCWIDVRLAEAATSQHPALADQASPCLSCCDT